MKRKILGIKWHLFLWLAVFVIVIIALLWVFQIVFLDDFYKFIKINEIKAATSDIAESIDDKSNVENIAKNNDLFVMICDENGQSNYVVNNISGEFGKRFTAEDIKSMASKAVENGGVFFECFEIGQGSPELHSSRKEPQPPVNMPEPDDNKKDGNKSNKSIIYLKIIKGTSSTEDVILLVTSRITPVDVTVKTLKIQLICVTVILLTVAVFLAFLISKKISNPIVKINECAKELARANYDVEFKTRSYKEIEELANTLNYAAGELNKTETLRRELIANVSHDLRTPLTLIAGYGEAIRDLPGENTKENIQIIIDESHRLTTLVNDMLDLSKLQSDAEYLNKEQFSVTEVISDILKRFSKLTAEDGFIFNFDADCDVFVEGDKIKLSQVIYNFLTNAVNYSGTSKEVYIRQKVENENVRIEVEDKGEGINEKEIPYIWDRYYKSDKTHKRAVVGTGIGLSIVKKILEKHGLRYGVLSEVGKGSIFWFEMKIVK